MNEFLASIDAFRLAGLTALDLFALFVVGISTLLAMFRGMSREALTLASWLGAAVVAYLAWPQVAPYLEPYLADATIRMVAAAVIAFVVPLITFLIIAGILSSLIENSFLSRVDRLLGLFFGAARGAVLVVVVYVVLLFVFPGADKPSWIADSAFRPWMDRAVAEVRALGPEMPLPAEEAAEAPPAEDSTAPATDGDPAGAPAADGDAVSTTTDGG
ncbi:MAG: CvpA family protein [Pseudomonadota bacterium]